MNYKYIEDLVTLAKDKNKEAEELLVEEFKAIIYGLSKKVFAPGYEIEDLISESYRILFNCVSKYDLKKHRFVAYSINAIKNNFKYILRESTKRHSFEGVASCDLSTDFEALLGFEEGIYERKDSDIIDRELLKYIMKGLSKDEFELVHLIVLKDYSLKEYAELKRLKYSTAVKKKKVTFDKLRIPITQFRSNSINI